MSEAGDTNKALVRRFYEALTKGDLDATRESPSPRHGMEIPRLSRRRRQARHRAPSSSRSLGSHGRRRGHQAGTARR